MNIEKFIEIFSGLNIAHGKFIPEDKNDAGKLQGKNQIIREPDGFQKNYGKIILMVLLVLELFQ